MTHSAWCGSANPPLVVFNNLLRPVEATIEFAFPNGAIYLGCLHDLSPALNTGNSLFLNRYSELVFKAPIKIRENSLLVETDIFVIFRGIYRCQKDKPEP